MNQKPLVKSAAPPVRNAAAVLDNWMPPHGLTPMQALEATYTAYAEAVDELNKLRLSEQDAQERLADAKARVYRDGVEGTNDKARDAYVLAQTARELRESQRATSLRQMADDTLALAKERLTLEKIRARAITALLTVRED